MKEDSDVAAEQDGSRRLHGRPRSFAGVLFSLVFTLGLYIVYYNFRIFKEVDLQLGRRHPAGLYLAAVVLTFGGLATSLVLAAKGLASVEQSRLVANSFNTLGSGLLIAYLVVEVKALNASCRSLGISIALPVWAFPGVIVMALIQGWTSSRFWGFAALAGWLVAIFLLQSNLNSWWQRMGGAQGVKATPRLHGQAS